MSDRIFRWLHYETCEWVWRKNALFHLLTALFLTLSLLILFLSLLYSQARFFRAFPFLLPRQSRLWSILRTLIQVSKVLCQVSSPSSYSNLPALSPSLLTSILLIHIQVPQVKRHSCLVTHTYTYTESERKHLYPWAVLRRELHKCQMQVSKWILCLFHRTMCLAGGKVVN